MKEYLIVSLLSLSSFLGLVAVLVSSPRKMIISWLAVGIIQSIFFISLGFELISLLNIIFVISSATVLKLFSSLYGSEKTSRSEKKNISKKLDSWPWAGHFVGGHFHFSAFRRKFARAIFARNKY